MPILPTMNGNFKAPGIKCAFAWGYLYLMAVCFHKRRLLLIALPMGFVDFLVPFAQSMGIAVFEAEVFVLSALSVMVAWYATRQVRKSLENQILKTNSFTKS